MSSVCIQLIVVAVTLSLSDVACQTVHNISISDNVHSVRERRQAQTLTQPLVAAIVDMHNILRSLEGANNMELVVWNTSLASLAATWAATCTEDHPGYSYPYGQNILRTDKILIDIVPAATKSWYGEKPNNGGHYEEVVYAYTRSVGCAVHHCPGFTNVVCNYWPGRRMAIYTRRDRRVRSAAVELDGARTNCATGNVQVLERTVRAPRSATTALSWTSQLVSVTVLRDGVAWTAPCIAMIRTRTAAIRGAGQRVGVLMAITEELSGQSVLLCAVCVKQTQTQKKASVRRCVDPTQTHHRRCSSRATKRR